jgi:hypothetical protein
MSPDDLNDAEGRAFGYLDAFRKRRAMWSGRPGARSQRSIEAVTSRLGLIRLTNTAARFRAPPGPCRRQYDATACREHVRQTVREGRAVKLRRRGERLFAAALARPPLFRADGVGAVMTKGCAAQLFVPS